MAAKSSYLLVFTTLLIGFTWFGCKSDDELKPTEVTLPTVLIANEGNFGWGEGTLSIYDEHNKTVQNDVYKAKNNTSLGNVFNSIASFNGLYFFVINNSGKIVITDSSFQKIQEIKGLISPRNIYRVSDNKAYITDLYADAITVIDLKTNAVIGTIPCNGHSEEGVVSNGTFWFTAPETSTIYAIDIAKDQITDSISVGWMPESIILDKNKLIWVLCRGDASKNKDAKLVYVKSDGAEKTTVAMGIDAVPTSLTYDLKNHTIYFLANGIRRLRVGVDSEPNLWKPLPNKVLYSAAVNPTSGDLYVSDVKDFVSKSTIFRYSSDGTLLDEFTTGIISGDFFFP
jgi:YVTN family beta-propeller protein